MGKESLFPKLFPGLQAKLSRAQPKPAAPAAGAPILKLLFFIVDWNRINIISQVFDEEKVRFHFICKGRGTAGSEVLDLLGIGANDKAVIFCLEQEVMAPILLKEVRKKLGFHSPGAGIAFTVPISGINTPILRVFKQSVYKNEKIAAEAETGGNTRPGSGGGAMSREAAEARQTEVDEFTHDLIIAVVNQGYSDELMNTARTAGAIGGTVINARGQAHQGPVKFFGVSVQDEKELILIMTNREKKTQIMRAVSEAHGMNTKAEGIVFSMPVDTVMGLSFE